jgi:hypothetical protein
VLYAGAPIVFFTTVPGACFSTVVLFVCCTMGLFGLYSGLKSPLGFAIYLFMLGCFLLAYFLFVPVVSVGFS